MENFFSFQTPLLILFSIIICLLFKHLMYRFYWKTNKRLPPSPPRIPIIGNLHQLGSCPYRSLHALSLKYGPVMLLHFGGVPTIVASTSEAAREILKTQDLSFCSRPNFTIAKILLYGCKDIAFAPYGEYWRQLKSVAVVHLLSATRVKSYQKVREKEMGLMLGVLAKSQGSLVDMGKLLTSLTNNITCMVAMGRKSDGLKLIHLITELLDTLVVFSVGTYIPWLKWVDRVTGLMGRAEKIAKEFDEVIEDIIKEHVNNYKENQIGSNEELNFVDILLEVEKDKTTGITLQRDSIKALILDMFMGGTDTGSTTLEMALSELVRHPNIMIKLQNEVTEIAGGRSTIIEADLEKMHYLKAVLKETLRLHPPLPLLAPRKTTRDVNLMGYDIPAGTQVIVNAWAIGRDPSFWEEATKFNPERFIVNPMSYKGDNNCEWLPFGAGRRECPGIQFGIVNVELALASIVNLFDLKLPGGLKEEELDMSETYGIVVHRKSPLMVIPTPRF